MAAGDRLEARVAELADPAAGHVLGLLHTHRLLAVVSLVSFAGLLAWRRRLGGSPGGPAGPGGRSASAYMAAAALAAGLVLTTAMYGGRIAHRDRTPHPAHQEPPAPLPPFPTPPSP